ncbi:MAG: PAS domain-containing protein [Chitinophagales bacterium]|nr:PAS domain-containing protein [Chitinophagales bacterium]
MNSIEKDQDFTLSIETLLREVSKLIPGVVFQYKKSTENAKWFSFCSPRSSEVLGVSPQEVYNNINAIYKCVLAEDVEPMRNSILETYSSLAPWKHFFRVKTEQEKSFRWMKGVAFPKVLHDGTIMWTGTMTDVTDERTIIEELQIMKRIIDATHEGIAICNVTQPGNPINYVNEAFLKMYGYSKEELIGNTHCTILGNGRHQQLLEQLRSKKITAPLQLGELELAKKDGTKFWDAVSIIPLQDSNGTTTHLASFHNDISERKKNELEIKAFNELLEKRVVERTQKLKEVNKELETFNYTVSHDLQSPLRLLCGYSKLVNKKYATQLDAEGVEFLKIIEDSSIRMSNLVRDLLAFSKIGKIDLDTEEIPMMQLVESVVGEVKKNYENVHTSIHVKQMGKAKGDYGLVKQVWSNLIENAVKYSSHQAKPKVEIGCELQENTCVYYVKDNGIGINPDEIDKIFEVFKRLSNSKDFEGTGVGLANVHRIITKHGGKIWIESELGKGSTFFFSLPC